MIERDAIVGVTSNPPLFQKAMTVGSAYEETMPERGKLNAWLRRASLERGTTVH